MTMAVSISSLWGSVRRKSCDGVSRDREYWTEVTSGIGGRLGIAGVAPIVVALFGVYGDTPLVRKW